MKNQAQNIFLIIIAIGLAVIAVRFVIWLLPLLIVAIGALFVYGYFQGMKAKRSVRRTPKTAKKSKGAQKAANSIEAEVVKKVKK